MRLIPNYKKYMNDETLDMEIYEAIKFVFTDHFQRVFEELKHQLNAVENYELKIKALNQDLEYVKSILKMERDTNENLRYRLGENK